MTDDLDLDFDDDLFEFDELVEPDEPDLPERVDASEPGGSPTAPPPRPLGLLDDDDPGLRQDPGHDEEYHPDEHHVVVAAGGMPPVVVPLLLVMAAANLALVGLTWKSMRAPDQLTLPVLHSTPVVQRDSTREGDAAMPGATGEGRQGLRAVPPLATSRDEAWAVLEEAQRALDAGHHVAARRGLYGMLTVIDRVEPAERPDLESRAGFLIAESYRLQAASMATAVNGTGDAFAPGAVR